MKIRILPLILLLSLTSYCSEKKKENNNILALLLLAGNQSSPERTQVIDEYNATYLGATVVNNGWTGSVSGCNPGITSQDANNKTLARVNYFRKQVGLPSVSFDSSTDGKTQSAALMMKANNALSHNPPGSWTCYTADGASGAASSNLYLGVHSAAAITGYIEDPGAGNTAVGHRRWILYSKSQKIGSGNTDSSNALWVIGNFLSSYPSTMPSFISWPPKGYVVRQLVFPRWSFAVPEANLSNATISMTGPDNGIIPLTKETYATGYGDNTVVWVPTGITTTSKQDQKYSVIISNAIVSGTAKSYQYDVILTDPGENGTITTIPSVTWTTTGSLFSYQAEGQQLLLNCPTGGSSNSTWGTDIYASASSVCTAAVHAGKITLTSGGQVTIIIRPSLTNYTGSNRNGINTFSLASWTGGSFVFK